MNASYIYPCIHLCLSQTDFLHPNKHAFINLAKYDNMYFFHTFLHAIKRYKTTVTEPSQIFYQLLNPLNTWHSGLFFQFFSHLMNIIRKILPLCIWVWFLTRKFLFEIRWQTRQRQLQLLSWHMTKPHQHHLQDPWEEILVKLARKKCQNKIWQIHLINWPNLPAEPLPILWVLWLNSFILFGHMGCFCCQNIMLHFHRKMSHTIVKPTKIMNRADKNWAHF